MLCSFPFCDEEATCEIESLHESGVRSVLPWCGLHAWAKYDPLRAMTVRSFGEQPRDSEHRGGGS